MSTHILASRRRMIVQGQSAVYHVVSRTAYGQFVFGDREKEMFVKMLHKQAAFSGVEIQAYCVMSNHFHVLVRVPDVAEISDKELLRRYRLLYGGKHCPASVPLPDVLAAMLRQNSEEGQAWRKKILSRMHDLRVFMRELKQRFGIWYNHAHKNKGTIWAERYRSVIVQDTAEALSTVAAYIDLNPVRAEIVEDPKDYRFSSYAAALGGNAQAKQAYCRMYAEKSAPGQKFTFDDAIAAYHYVLYGKGQQSKGVVGKDRGTIDPVKARKVLAKGGKISLPEALRLRIRYFSDGAILGSREYVMQVSQAISESLPMRVVTGAEEKQKQPSRLKGINTASLYSFRRLIRCPVG